MWKLANVPPVWYVAFWSLLFVLYCSFWAAWLWVFIRALRGAR